MSGCARALRLTQMSTVGGSALTLANAFAVKPGMRPACVVVTTATPVANRRIAALNASLDTGTDTDPISDRNDRGIELRMGQEDLIELADRPNARAVARGRLLGCFAGPQQVVDH